MSDVNGPSYSKTRSRPDLKYRVSINKEIISYGKLYYLQTSNITTCNTIYEYVVK